MQQPNIDNIEELIAKRLSTLPTESAKTIPIPEPPRDPNMVKNTVDDIFHEIIGTALLRIPSMKTSQSVAGMASSELRSCLQYEKHGMIDTMESILEDVSIKVNSYVDCFNTTYNRFIEAFDSVNSHQKYLQVQGIYNNCNGAIELGSLAAMKIFQEKFTKMGYGVYISAGGVFQCNFHQREGEISKPTREPVKLPVLKNAKIIKVPKIVPK